jgi:uncharacterized repeat protein (TIGR01451 family)
MWNSPCNMYKFFSRALIVFATCAMFASAARSGQTTSEHIDVRVVAEVQTRITDHGRQVTKLQPADSVVPGDLVIYTLEARNVGPMSIDAPSVVQPVPAHMMYVAESATGPGAFITFSVDGGNSFDTPENLKVTAVGGKLRAAAAADYTHIRWQLRSLVKANSVAFLRFRARVK